ncbi:adenylate/guanylate cyclase domain-containing protein [Aquimarina sp. ERC-38]|uniref:adenylate/guanylate cyclase domain-containing protein n=1 Tax=Aquimarina sp. ERC-38 TaxID=2949996 RepID=UPI00224812B3|nr:adenylate/guanylate cyclase domain-containing protein [Aquimarina sp. ERC-38]UZO82332.1 adenylate/guanylate cyclase domain-containing protein [Aquimarina sp. ERC-38]
MNYSIKQFLKLLGNTVLFWTVAFCIFIVIRYYALGDEEGLDNSAVPIWDWLRIGFIFGSIIGFFYAIVDFVFDNFLSKRLALWFVLLQKSIIYMVVLIWSTSFVFGLLKKELDLNYIHQGDWWRTSKIFWVIVVYFILASLIFSFIKIANENFGSGVFFKLLLGRYQKPREEQQIFMFLDLKSSTAIAEQLGHFKYSEFIQDSFYDLNRVLLKYDANVYQYVGDEAVLHWPFKSGIRSLNCIRVYFAFIRRLLKRKKYYLRQYGLLPEFKAGLHGGKLIATEVGSVKKEIAFHGDVINTTARIQEQCNFYDQSLLISEDLLAFLKLKSRFIATSIGNISLKGKEEKVVLYSITPAKVKLSRGSKKIISSKSSGSI